MLEAAVPLQHVCSVAKSKTCTGKPSIICSCCTRQSECNSTLCITQINELGCHVRPTPQHFLQPLALESHGKQQVKPQSSSPSGSSALITTSPATRSCCIDTLCWNTAPATSPGAATAAVTAQEGRHSSAGHIFGTTSTSYTSLHKVR